MIFLLFVVLISVTAPLAHAQVPPLLEYDGLLPENITGNRSIGVRLFDSSSNGTLLYKENIGTVKVTNGEFYFQYGQNGTAGNSTSPINMTSALKGNQHWLAITVNGTEQTPRFRLLSVPFALRSADAQATDADLRKTVNALGKVLIAFGSNATNILSDPDGAVATIEKQAKVFLEMRSEYRVVALSGNLAFGNVTIGSPTQATLTISNKGFGKLNVTRITYPEGFNGNWSAGDIPPGGSKAVTVTFAPTASKAYGGNLSVVSNATGGIGVCAVSGIGKNGPSLIGNMITVSAGTLAKDSLLAGQKVATFQIGKFEVTWGEWKTVRDWAVANGYSDLAGKGGTYPSESEDNFPVTKVSWYDVVKWCNAKSEKEKLTPVYFVSGAIYKTGKSEPSINTEATGYRLPTEAEWEWAARGGASSKGSTYSGNNSLDAVAWNKDNSEDATHAVGTKAANEIGIYDMSGNVREWLWNSTGNQMRHFRGGGYKDTVECAVAYRGSPPYVQGAFAPGGFNSEFGFRLARTPLE